MEYVKVGINYAPKEKYITRLKSDPDMTKSIATTLPRISFEIAGINYDPTRKQQSVFKHRGLAINPNRPYSQYMGIPYKLTFNMSIYVRNIEDGTMIIEQILPYFQPDYTITADLIPEMGISKDIPIILESIQENNDYIGSLDDSPRIVTWDLTFAMNIWLFGPVANTAIIKGVQTGNAITGGVTTNIYYDRRYNQVQQLTVTSITSGDFHEGEIVTVDARGISGKVYSWSNVSNTLIITSSTGTFATGDSIRGVISNTIRIANTTISTPMLLTEIYTVQKPITANADNDYGYTTTITEFPNTL